MALLSGWPSVTDDPGDLQSGTIFSKALTDAVKASVEDNVHPTGSASALKAKDTIQEVFDARGSQPSLDARLDVSLNGDGTLITPAGLATITQVNGGLGEVNLVENNDFQLWHLGDALAPSLWTLSGAGAGVARTGTGLGDTNRKIGDFAAKITRAAADARLDHAVLDAAGIARADFIKNAYYVTVGCWVRAATSSQARISLYDGVTRTYSSFHTGNSTWQWLSVTGTLVGSSASELALALHVDNSAGDVHFSGAVAMFVQGTGSVVTRYVPVPVELVPYVQSFALPTGSFIVDEQEMQVARPVKAGLYRYGRLQNQPASGASATRVRVFVIDGGGSWQDVFASPYLETANTKGYTTKKPDGTYQWRCLMPGTEVDAVAPSAASGIRSKVEQIQATTVSGISVTHSVMHYMSPLDIFKA